MESITRFLEKKLRLKVNREKSAVGSTLEEKFLGYTMTWHSQARRLKVVTGIGINRAQERVSSETACERPVECSLYEGDRLKLSPLLRRLDQLLSTFLCKDRL